MFADEDIVQMETLYNSSSDDLYDVALELLQRYPEILKLEVIGWSVDQNPIYVIRMSEGIDQEKRTFSETKMNILLDAGVHGRETYNPVMTLRMIEDYAMDYYDDQHLPGYNMQAMLQKNIFHFIPLVNPDGFDIAKFGGSTIQINTVKQAFVSWFADSKLFKIKSNLNGVDLNRNFDDQYFDVTKQTWLNRNNIYKGALIPGLENFKGKQIASEPETQTIMNYMNRFDFRAYASFHSMGRAIYYRMDYLGASYIYLNRLFAEAVAKKTGYQLMTPERSEKSGYSTAYFANRFLKPAMTVETLNTNVFPTPFKNYSDEYQQRALWQVPLILAEKANQQSYFPYKLYVAGTYVCDYKDKTVALARAKLLGGEIQQYTGIPMTLRLTETEFEITGQMNWKGVLASNGQKFVYLDDVLLKASQLDKTPTLTPEILNSLYLNNGQRLIELERAMKWLELEK